MAFLTVFSTPKPFFNPHIATIQRNAIQSWQRLGPDVQVLLVGEEDGLAETAAEYNVSVLPQVQRNASGTPLVSSIFALARQASDSPFLAYVNADILLMPDLMKATRQIQSTLGAEQPFLLIGQRWDLDVTQPLDFSTGWDERLRNQVNTRGCLHAPAGSDYFVFPRAAFHEMPEFAIGRAGWDNWMIYHAIEQNWPVIDGTPSIMIVHQNHDYSHLPGGKPHYDLDESFKNMELGGGMAHMYLVLDAKYQLINGRLQRASLTSSRLVRALERHMLPKDGQFRGLRGTLARRLRRLRRKLVRDYG